MTLSLLDVLVRDLSGVPVGVVVIATAMEREGRQFFNRS